MGIVTENVMFFRLQFGVLGNARQVSAKDISI
jgi:hypothetical protein